ncbi:serine hydrolase domain-containing protein [Nonomuraea longicatena]|uniref:Beta-lactamase-related domain-containing protein n=1 Tax=Nonomuraea longicatena TaxID=83682 RepID=A0ABN1NVK8_9ACTN
MNDAHSLVSGTVHALVGSGHAPAAVGVALRGSDQAVVTAGNLARPAPGAVEAGPGTLFALGSITKTFTALLLAEMAATGAVACDDPIRAHLPAEAVPRNGAAAITLGQLAAHRAGLPRLPRGLRRRSLPYLLSDPYARYRVEDLHRAVSRLRPPREAPQVRYSTFGVGLLGHLLARAAGTPYPELLAERVLTPLGMRDTLVPPEETLTRRAAVGHRRGRPVPHWRFDALEAAGALYSTGADLLRYLQAQLHPDTVPEPLATALLTARRQRHEDGGASLGWNVREIRGRTLLWHSGGTGGFTAFAGFSPDSAAGVAILASTAPSLRQPVIHAARRLFRSVVFG